MPNSGRERKMGGNYTLMIQSHPWPLKIDQLGRKLVKSIQKKLPHRWTFATHVLRNLLPSAHITDGRKCNMHWWSALLCLHSDDCDCRTEARHHQIHCVISYGVISYLVI